MFCTTIKITANMNLAAELIEAVYIIIIKIIIIIMYLSLKFRRSSILH